MARFRAWYADTPDAVLLDIDVDGLTPRAAAEHLVDIGPRTFDDGDDVEVHVEADDGTVSRWTVDVECEWSYTTTEIDDGPGECSCDCGRAPECEGK